MYDHPDHLVLMTEGEAMLQPGDETRAQDVFGNIYALYGRKGFAEHQKTYLAMLLKQQPPNAQARHACRVRETSRWRFKAMDSHDSSQRSPLEAPNC